MLRLCTQAMAPSPVVEPEVAVIIPTYNQGDLLLEAIASVEREAAALPAGKLELLIVNDGSTDLRSLSILEHLEKAGYRILHQQNEGLSAARNAGLRLTTAPIIIPLDDDNILLDGYFDPGLHLMACHPEIAVLYGDRKDFGLINQIFRPGALSEESLLRMNRIDACALIRRNWIHACGGYDESLSAFEDWDLWLSILARGGNLCYLPKLCFSYRHRPGSMIRRHFGSKVQQQRVIEKLKRKHQKLIGVP